MQIVFFNGPPNTGKDEAADMMVTYLEAKGKKVVRYAFSNILKDSTHLIYGLTVDTHHYEDSKDIASQDFGGLSPRQAYIKVSEKIIKPIMGYGHFGRAFVNYLKSLDKDTNVIVSDLGFMEELDVVAEYIKDLSNLYVVHMYREGCTFKGDSRKYITYLEKNYRIDNNGSISDLAINVELLTKEIFHV